MNLQRGRLVLAQMHINQYSLLGSGDLKSAALHTALRMAVVLCVDGTMLRQCSLEDYHVHLAVEQTQAPV